MTNTSVVVVTSVATTTVAAIVVVVSLILLRAKARTDLVRGICVAGIVLAAALAPALVDFLIMHLKRTDMFVSIDPGLVTLWSPSVVALAAGGIAVASRKRHMPAN